MKIAVFEFDYHFVVLSTFCRLFEGSGHQLTVFTTTDLYNKIKKETEDYSCTFILKDKENLKTFFENNLALINSHDLLFFNTIASNYRTYCKTNFTPTTILRIHNSHSFLKPFRHLYFPKSFFELKKFISYIFRIMIPTLDFYYIKKLIKKLDFICMNDLYREEYVIEKKMIDQKKIFPCLPFAMCDNMGKEIRPDSTFLSIVIPGAIDERRRNYSPVIAALKKAIPLLKGPIRIHLLGRPVGNYGQKTIAAFRELENDKFQMITFNEFVSQEKFDSVINDADLLIAPLVVENQLGIYKEIYGKSKSSGSIYDMVTYGKLTVFSSNFFVDAGMKKVVDYYATPDELCNILIGYTNDRSSLVNKSRDLRTFLEANYSPKKILSDFEKNITQRIRHK